MLINHFLMQKPKQFDFILEQCSSDQQREILLTIRAAILQDERVKEFADTRHIIYARIKSDPCAEIIYKQNWENPRLILRLPSINKSFNKSFTNQSNNRTKRYGIDINLEGSPDTKVTVYQIKELKQDGLIQLSDLLKLLKHQPSEPEQIYQELIDLTLKNLK